MIKMTLSEAASIIGCSNPVRDAHFQGVSIDSRTIEKDNLYVAIQGERLDGHQFVTDAFQKGASAVMVQKSFDPSLPQLIVDQTIDALGQLSTAWRSRFTLPLVAVTGSNGKTTLKTMIASILKAACNNQPNMVLATEGNYNNHIGLPLTLLRLSANQRYGVIEMGMNHLGEIAYLSKLTKPMVAVINNAAESHLEGLKTVAGVATAKGEIFQGLDEKGTAILNRDDPHFNYWKTLITKQPILTFGLNETADVTALHIKDQKFTLQTPKGQIDIDLPLIGKHNIMNALAAAASTIALDLDLSAIKRGLEQMIPVSGRMCSYLLDNGTRVIDDTYNANPFSLKAAVTTLATLSGKKIVVLGDMKELGENTKEMHFDSGVNMRDSGIDYLFTFGELSEKTAEGFGKGALHFKDREQLIVALKPYLTPNTNILVKGSRSMKMEKILLELIPNLHLDHAH